MIHIYNLHIPKAQEYADYDFLNRIFGQSI